MIYYVNRVFKDAGKVNTQNAGSRDYRIDSELEIDKLNDIIKKYGIITTTPGTGHNYLRLELTIINIFKNRDEI